MSFLMGLNDSYAQVRGQLLLMDPLPPINKVFSLITQEERQRKVGSQSILAVESTNTMAFTAKYEGPTSVPHVYKGQKKERPFCTHFQYHDHTVEKYYKLHRYPPSFKRQKKNPNASGNNVVVNQITTQPSDEDKVDTDNTNIGSFFEHLNSAECHQLMTMLSTHLIKTTDQADCPSTSYTTCTCLFVSVNLVFSSSNTWIIDSGASRHICANAYDFIAMRPLHGSTVTLPNKTSILVHFTGDVRINY